MIEKRNITGIILAGGKSSRMQSDKALMRYNGIPFIQHVINAATPLVEEMIIVADSAKYSDFGLKCVPDRVKNAGPLAGIYTGLEASRNELNLVLSCDIPLINTLTLGKIIKQIDNEHDVIMVSGQGHSMPLVAVYKKRCSPHFKELLGRGERKLLNGIAQLNVKIISLDEEAEKTIININTPAVYKKINDEIIH